MPRSLILHPSAMGIGLATLLIMGCCSLPALAQRAPVDSVLPAALPGWRLAEAPRMYKGDALFELIDGGAVLYQEYGFDHVVTGEYLSDDGREIDAEVYTMLDAGAACGIFAITAAAGEQELPLGDEGALGEYFLVFRQGRHVVTVSGQSSDNRTRVSVQHIGREIETRIGSGNEDSPGKEAVMRGGALSGGETYAGNRGVEFLNSFRALVTRGTRPVYVRGPVAVGNFYLFAPQNTFHVREGVTGERDSTRFFVFLYRDAAERGHVLAAATASLRANEKYSNIVSSAASFTASDRDGNLLRCTSTGNALVIVIGRAEQLIHELEADVQKVLHALDLRATTPSPAPPGAK